MSKSCDLNLANFGRGTEAKTSPHTGAISAFTSFRDAPFDIWGGFCCLQTFFFTSGGKQAFFFWRSTSDNFFFMLCRRNFLSYAFPIMYVTIWCFFWSTYFSSISPTNSVVTTFQHCSVFTKNNVLAHSVWSYYHLFGCCVYIWNILNQRQLHSSPPPPPPPPESQLVRSWLSSPAPSPPPSSLILHIVFVIGIVGEVLLE